MDGRLVVLEQAEAGSVGVAIEDGGVGAFLRELRAGGFDGVFAGAFEFVFPSDNPRAGEPAAEAREDLGGGFEDEMDLREVAGNFACLGGGAVGSANGGDGIIGKRGGVEDGADVGGAGGCEFLQLAGEIVVGGEFVEQSAGRDGGVRGAAGAEEEGLEAVGGEGFGEEGADFAGGEVGDAAHFVDRRGGGAGGDEGEHLGRKMPVAVP